MSLKNPIKNVQGNEMKDCVKIFNNDTSSCNY